MKFINTDLQDGETEKEKRSFVLTLGEISN